MVQFLTITFNDRMGGKKKSRDIKVDELSQNSASEESEEDYIVERVVDKRVRSGKVLLIFFNVLCLFK